MFHQERPFLSMYDQHVRNCMKLLGALESTFTGLSIRLTMRCILVVVVHGGYHWCVLKCGGGELASEIAQNER